MAIRENFVKKNEASQQFEVPVLLLGAETPVLMIKSELNRRKAEEGLLVDYCKELKLYWQMTPKQYRELKRDEWRLEKRESKHSEMNTSLDCYTDTDTEQGALDDNLTNFAERLDLQKAVTALSDEEKAIAATITQGMTKVEGAAYCGLRPSTYQDKKAKLYAKLRKALA